MGSDYASFFAIMRASWLIKSKKIDSGRARHFENILSFIDDLTALLDNGEFERSFHKIYPSELEKKEGKYWSSVRIILDLMILWSL